MIAVIAALAAAGVLVCVAAILDVFIPTESLVGFLIRMALLGVAMTGVVTGYIRLCDKCDGHVKERLDRHIAAPGLRASPELRISSERLNAPDASQFRSCRPLYITTLRGDNSPRVAGELTNAHRWHGQ